MTSGVVAWLFDGQIYCDDCVDDDHKTPEYYEGWGGPRSAEDDDADACCGTCGHSIGCTMRDASVACFPCDNFPPVKRPAARTKIIPLRNDRNDKREELEELIHPKPKEDPE